MVLRFLVLCFLVLIPRRASSYYYGHTTINAPVEFEVLRPLSVTIVRGVNLGTVIKAKFNGTGVLIFDPTPVPSFIGSMEFFPGSDPIPGLIHIRPTSIEISIRGKQGDLIGPGGSVIQFSPELKDASGKYFGVIPANPSSPIIEVYVGGMLLMPSTAPAGRYSSSTSSSPPKILLEYR